jgi:hypothetical protein
MAQFRKILLSGSNAHVAQVTASNIPQVTDNNTVLFANNSGVVRTLSSLTYNSATPALEFNGGTFSGSFTGDGSGLTGVTSDLNNPLSDGAGITALSFDGSTGATASLDLSPDGGLTFYDGSGNDVGTSTGNGTDDYELGITSSLPSDGLEWVTAGDYHKMRINLNGASNGASGLKLVDDGLSISDNIAGNGLTLSSGVINVTPALQGGLEIDGSGELKISSSLPGTGLEWATDSSELQIDSSVVVDDGNTITFKTGSNNIVISLTQDGGGITDTTAGKVAKIIKNPVLELNLNDTLTGNFTFNGDVTIAGDLTVESGTEVSLETQNLNIADQFILVNSGSTTGDGGIVVQTTSAAGSFLVYDSNNQRWGVSGETIGLGVTDHSVLNTNYAAIVSVELVSDNEATILSSDPLFGASDVYKYGQMKITTAAAAGESALYIFS